VIALIYAHLHPARARANRVLVDAARAIEVMVRSSVAAQAITFESDIRAHLAA
jgi:hypothetical protein